MNSLAESLCEYERRVRAEVEARRSTSSNEEFARWIVAAWRQAVRQKDDAKEAWQNGGQFHSYSLYQHYRLLRKHMRDEMMLFHAYVKELRRVPEGASCLEMNQEEFL